MLTLRGLGRVLGDLAAMGYDAKWCVLGACDAGSPHKRERIWILGYLADAAKLLCNGRDDNAGISMGRQISESGNSSGAETMADDESGESGQPSERQGREDSSGGSCDCGGDQGARKSYMENTAAGRCEKLRQQRSEARRTIPAGAIDGGAQWEAEPAVGRVADGVENRVDRLKSLGNGQVPQCAALAWRTLSEGII